MKEIYLRKSKFVTRQVGSDLIMVPIKGNVTDMNELFTLNEVGAFIWENINGENTKEDIVKLVTSEFKVNEKTAETDVVNFILQLKKMILKD